LPSLPPEKSEAYRWVDDWFTANVPSYQIHLAPREFYFMAETTDALPSEISELREHLGEHGGYCLAEATEAGNLLTAKLPVYPDPKPRYFLHAGLFLATLLTTVSCAGYGDISRLEIQGQLSGAIGEWFAGTTGVHTTALIEFLGLALSFAVPFLLILTVHEFGHYFAAKYHRVLASLPFYLPFPIGIGSMGAVIALRSPLLHRRMVFDVGVAGPLAGFAVALPILTYGILTSDVEPRVTIAGAQILQEGKSVLYFALLWLIKGPIPDTHDISLNGTAWAGWLGMLITSINLLPIGQLDGGHVIYSMFGRLHRMVARIAFVLLIGLCFFTIGFIFFAVLVFFVIKLDHPPPVDDRRGLDRKRQWVGWLAILIFIITFVPSLITFSVIR
jgi:hypothetical protein